MLELPTVNELPAKLSEEEISTLSDEVRALATERDAVILAHNYQLPELQDVADFVGDSLGLSRQAAKADADGDRVLRRPLHGRDRLGPLSRQDGPDRRPRGGLLPRGVDQRRPAPRLEGRAPRRGGGHVRQHLGRGEGRDRLLLHLGQRRPGRRAHPPRARAGHRDPLRPRHVARRLRRARDRHQGATPSAAPASTSGTASATSTPGSAPTTSRPSATSTRTPSS